MTPKAFVTGYPVKHSKSPLLHGYWLKHYAIDGSYEAVEVAPDQFHDFAGKISEQPSAETFIGGNVTIPHKEVAHGLVTRLDEAAEMIGAVNTLWMQEGTLHGGNTDAYGFGANLDDYAPGWREGKTALVFGAGGASRAIIHAALEAGYRQIHIVNRTFSRAEILAKRFGDRCSAHDWAAISELLPESDLLVNTTSLGMAGASQEPGALSLPSLEAAKTMATVSDIVYTPLETPFLKEATRCGLKTVDGLGMLLHQAVPGFERWFGLRPEVTPALRRHILETRS